MIDFNPFLLVICRINPFNAEATYDKSTRTQRFLKPSKPSHAGIHKITLAKPSHMSTHLPVFPLFFRLFASFSFGQISHQQSEVEGIMWYEIEVPSTSDGTCFSHDKKEKFKRFTVKLAS